MKRTISKLLSRKLHLSILVLIFSITAILGGYIYSQREANSVYFHEIEELRAIGKLKEQQITQWVRERNSEALFFSRNATYLDNIKTLIKDFNNKIAYNSLYAGLNHIKQSHGYENIFVVSTKYNIILSLDTTFSKFGNNTRNFIHASISRDTLIFSDFYQGDLSKKYHLDVIAPIESKQGTVVAAMVFRFDPERYLFPLIESWPIPSNTAETMVVRQDGDSIVYINQLRYNNHKSNSLKISQNDMLNPAVQAVKGYRGVFDGKDYRDKEVLAYIRPIEGTAWYMIAKMDKDEVLSQLYDKYLFIGFFILFIILLVSLGASFLYAYRQKRTYKFLWESEEEFRTTLYSIGDGVITTDRAGRVKYLNNVAQQLTGWTEKDAKGKPIEKVFNILDETTRYKIENPFEVTLNGGLPNGLANNTLLISKDGKERLISNSGSPIKNENGEINGVVLVFRDKTEEIKQNIKLQESEDRWQFAIEGTGDGLWDWDATTNKVYFSKTWKSMLGYDNDEIKNDFTEWEKRLHPDDREKTLKEVEKHLSGETEIYRSEHRLLCKDGSYKWILDRGKVIKWSDDGKPLRIIGTHKDIDKQKKIELQLETTQFGVDNAEIGIYQISEEGKILYANKYAARSLGYSVDELLKMNISDIDAGFTDDNFKEHRDQVKNKGNITITSKHKRKDGSVFPIELTVNYIRFKNNLFSISFAKDITEQQEALNALRKSETRFRLLANSAPVGIIIYNNDGKTIYVNEYFTRIFGFTLNDIPTIEHWWKVAYPNEEFRENVKTEWLDLYKNSESTYDAFDALEFPVTCKNGKIKQIEFRLSTTEEFNFIVMSDITERKNAEISLIQNEKLLRESQETAEIGSYILDILNDKWNCTNVLDRIFGITEGFPKTSAGWSQIIHPDWRNIMMNYLTHDVIQQKKMFNKEYKIIRINDKKERWVHGIGRLEYDKDGNAIKMIGTIQDITERRNYKDELEELKNKLEIQVKDKTEELHQRIAELERFREATMDRELRMKELRDEIKRLKGES